MLIWMHFLPDIEFPCICTWYATLHANEAMGLIVFFGVMGCPSNCNRPALDMVLIWWEVVERLSLANKAVHGCFLPIKMPFKFAWDPCIESQTSCLFKNDSALEKRSFLLCVCWKNQFSVFLRHLVWWQSCPGCTCLTIIKTNSHM